MSKKKPIISDNKEATDFELSYEFKDLQVEKAAFLFKPRVRDLFDQSLTIEQLKEKDDAELRKEISTLTPEQVNLKNNKGQTLLMLAAAQDSDLGVELLISNGAKTLVKDRKGRDASSYVGKSDILDFLPQENVGRMLVKELLSERIDIEQRERSKRIKEDPNQYLMELLKDSSEDHSLLIKEIIEKATVENLEKLDYEGKTPLMYAASLGTRSAVTAVLALAEKKGDNIGSERHINVNQKDNNGKSILDYVKKVPDFNLTVPEVQNQFLKNKENIARALLRAGAEIDDKTLLDKSSKSKHSVEFKLENNIALLAQKSNKDKKRSEEEIIKEIIEDLKTTLKGKQVQQGTYAELGESIQKDLHTEVKNQKLSFKEKVSALVTFKGFENAKIIKTVRNYSSDPSVKSENKKTFVSKLKEAAQNRTQQQYKS